MGSRFTMKPGGGFASAVKSLKRVTDQGTRAHKKAVNAMTQAIFDKSQEYCPVDTEELKSTAYWTFDSGTETYRGKSQDSYMTYILYPAPYAVYVHECVDHFHEPPTSARFIARSVDELWSELNQIAGAAYRNAFFAEFSSF